ncbi:MAG: hypothetical protein Q27BB25_14600 [Blastomonas sp. CACIA14H2]|nr:MAG: hypothetical protein Q27BB25_14600 [Blastomonas sp. CACIA14H2]
MAEEKKWGEIIPPNGTTYIKARVNVSWDETNQLTIGDGQRVIAPAICVAASYFSVGGQTCLQTGMCFIIGRVADGSFRVIFHEPRLYSFDDTDIVVHPGACVIT